VLGVPASIMGSEFPPTRLRPFVVVRNIRHFLWYGVVAGDGLRSVGEDVLPSSKSVCSILPIAICGPGLPHLPGYGAPALRFAPPNAAGFLMYTRAMTLPSLYIRNIIPGSMSIPSPASLAYRGGAKRLVSNDVEEEFSEVRGSNLPRPDRGLGDRDGATGGFCPQS